MLIASFVFWFKKTVSRLLFPSALIFYPLAIGVALILFGKSKRQQLLGKIGISTSLALFILFSMGPFSALMLRPLETKYPIFNLEALQEKHGSDWSPKYIVVLAGDFKPNRKLPPSATVGPRTQNRMSEGVRIHRAIPGSKLVFTGGKIYEDDPFTIAEQMGELTKIWGVDENDVILEQQSRDTKDHVKYVGEIVGDEPFVIVTSAAHIPRSMMLFEGGGLNPVAAPTNFRAIGRIEFGWNWFVPKLKRVDYAENAFYEYMGIAWAKLRGQT